MYDGCPPSRFGLLDGGARELGHAQVLAGVGVGPEGLLAVLPGCALASALAAVAEAARRQRGR